MYESRRHNWNRSEDWYDKSKVHGYVTLEKYLGRRKKQLRKQSIGSFGNFVGNKLKNYQSM